MMRAAVIDKSGAGVNVIVADPEKDSIPGFQLVAVPDGLGVDSRWIWNENTGFEPSERLVADMAARKMRWNAEQKRFEPTEELLAEWQSLDQDDDTKTDEAVEGRDNG